MICYKTLKTTTQIVKIEVFPFILNHLFHGFSQIDQNISWSFYFWVMAKAPSFFLSNVPAEAHNFYHVQK